MKREETYLKKYSEEILVRCPKCQKCAVLISVKNEHQIKCSHCLLRLSEMSYQGPICSVVSQPCYYCGRQIGGSKVNPKYKKMRLRCYFCKKAHGYDYSYSTRLPGYPIDPFFGNPLYLQTGVREETIWAYNLSHLKLIKEYVSSEDRRVAHRNKYGLFSNLPKWIILKKNQKKVLKAIQKIYQIAESDLNPK